MIDDLIEFSQTWYTYDDDFHEESEEISKAKNELRVKHEEIRAAIAKRGYKTGSMNLYL